MIANHPLFIDAIHEKKKVRVRLYSIPDHGVVDRVCAPMDYGPSPTESDGQNRYWLWDYAGLPGSNFLGLLPLAILDLHVLGEKFDPSQINPKPAQWSTPRNWDLQASLR